MIGEPIDVYRPISTEGSYGDDTLTYPDTASHTITGVAVAPRSSAENNDGRTAVIVGLTLYPPADADLLPTDQVEIRGDRYEVEGEIGEWRSPFTGWAPGGEVAVKRVAG